MNGWGIHRLRDIYSPNCQAGLPDGRWVAAVSKPYTNGKLWAAWAVLTERAYAFEWPKAGDLEDILGSATPGFVDSLKFGGWPPSSGTMGLTGVDGVLPCQR